MKDTITLDNKTILVTGSPGFIGANLVLRLLKDMAGGRVVSFDNMNDYYDQSLRNTACLLLKRLPKNHR